MYMWKENVWVWEQKCIYVKGECFCVRVEEWILAFTAPQTNLFPLLLITYTCTSLAFVYLFPLCLLWSLDVTVTVHKSPLHNKGPQDWGYDNYYYIVLLIIIVLNLSGMIWDLQNKRESCDSMEAIISAIIMLSWSVSQICEFD